MNAHIRKKPKTREGDQRLLQDRPDLGSRYSASPWTVLIDGENLERIDLWVYCCMAARAFKSDLVSVRWDWIAGVIKSSRPSVKRSVQRLTENGHLEVVEPAKGSRAALYRLKSAVFAKRQKVIVSDRSGSRQTTRAELDRKLELTSKLRTA